MEMMSAGEGFRMPEKEMQGEEAKKAEEEMLWKQFFKAPSLWWDKRLSKRSPRSPDFKHSISGKSLWIQSWYCPCWVVERLELLQPSVATGRSETRAHYRDENASGTRQRSEKERILETLAALKSARGVEEGREIHADAAGRGIDSVFYVASSLVNLYAKFSCMEEARKVFDKMASHDVVLWTVLIMGYAKSGQGDAALRCFEEMKSAGCAPNRQTYVAVLKACSSVLAKEEDGNRKAADLKMKCLERVMAIHFEAARSDGIDSYVESTLIDLYAKCGSMSDARRVFDSMSVHSAVSWTVLMIGYVSNGENELALECFDRMSGDGGCRMDSQAFVAAIKACTGLAVKEEARKSGIKAGLLEKGFLIELEAVKCGCGEDVYLGSSLVDFYSKCGSMKDSRRVFDGFHLCDVVSYTALIFGYAHNGDNEMALEVFSQMSCAPNEQSFVAALHACTNLAMEEDGTEINGRVFKLKSLEKGMALHCEAARRGFHTDLCVCSTLVDLYAKCGSVLEASRVFHRMQRHDLISWTALMLGFAQNGEGEAALELFSQMRSQGWIPDHQTYVAALKACCNASTLETGKKIQGEIYRYGLESDARVGNSLVDLYGKFGSMIGAQQLFDCSGVANREVILWNSLITGYARQGDTKIVLELFRRLEEDEGMEADAITGLAVLNACSHSGLVEKGRKYFEEMRCRSKFGLEIEHYHCVVDMLGRANQLEKAVEFVRSMPFEADVVTWTIVMSACEKWNNVEIGRVAYEALVRLDEKQASTYVLMTNLCAR